MAFAFRSTIIQGVSIKEKREEIKGGEPSNDYVEEEFDIVPKGGSPSAGKHILNISLIVLLATFSFGLGRISLYEESRTPVRIIPPPGGVVETVNTLPDTGKVKGVTTEIGSQVGEVVASKSGSKYHLPWCAGAKQISEKNKIIFASPEEARKAGYTPASNCKGLK